MANSVFLKVSDLRSCIQELRRDGIEYIQLSISDSDTDFDGDFIPLKTVRNWKIYLFQVHTQAITYFKRYA